MKSTSIVEFHRKQKRIDRYAELADRIKGFNDRDHIRVTTFILGWCRTSAPEKMVEAMEEALKLTNQFKSSK